MYYRKKVVGFFTVYTIKLNKHNKTTFCGLIMCNKTIVSFFYSHQTLYKEHNINTGEGLSSLRQNHLWHRFYKMFIQFHRDTVVIQDNITASCNCCRFSFLPHPKSIVQYSDLVTWMVTEKHWTRFHVHESSLRWLLLCYMVHHHAGSSD